MIAVGLLAAAKGGEAAKSGPIGLAVILVLCIAVYFLFKSMSKHLRRVREEFPTDEAGQSASQPAPPGDAATDVEPETAPPAVPAPRPPDPSA
jgi:hypothetical protein